MEEYIAFDSHKRYTLAEREDVRTGRVKQQRIEHGLLCANDAAGARQRR
jgi:hypothetical protein